MMIAQQDVTAFENKTIKLVSLRFLSVVPENDDDEIRIAGERDTVHCRKYLGQARKNVFIH
ncbi:unnamed protein product [Toxocara canis]|uniref:Kinesin motor domain-containing protein n=1 Tax=Toxocara canis TaxID=6265 RepID=A0A183U2I2_TOXCA|nr:unnamed protein product [Toxocara canis]